jgi:hypothetical protein
LYWLNLDGFDDAVKEGWACSPAIVDPFARLDEYFRSLAAHLQTWADRKVGNLKLQIAMANILIQRFDAAQDSRDLTPEEWWLRKTLKLTVLGLSSLERTMAHQRSRMKWLKDGDANTKLFHVAANGRRVKNFIPAIKHEGVLVSDQIQKEEVFFQVYNSLLGSIETRDQSIDLEAIGMVAHDLSNLGDIFSEAEVWNTIKEIPSEKAPGPDGFIGAFYKRAWPIIKREIMAAVLKLYVGDGRGFGRLNKALITLIPKKQEAQEVGDFRPISLVHSFAKLFTKLLANRLRPKMADLVKTNQSAFIQGRSLHDNFILVRYWRERSTKGRRRVRC